MQANPYTLPLMLAALVSAGLAYVAWRRRTARGSLALMGALIGVAQWSFASSLQFASVSLEAQRFWYQARFVGTELLSVAFLAFAIRYLGRPWPSRRNLVLLLSVPAALLLLLWTNDWHGLFITATRQASFNGFSVLEVEHGPLFWVHTAYDYMLLAAGLLLFANAFLETPRVYRAQIIAIVVAVLAPLAANALTLSGLSPYPHLDLTPFGFTITGLALAAGFIGFGILDIVPAARDAVIQNMSDAVFVLDIRQRVVDLNPAAEKVCGCPAGQVVGKPAAQVLPGLQSLFDGGKIGALRETLSLSAPAVQGGDGPAQRDYEVRLSSIADNTGRLTGHVLLLRDLTEHRAAETSLRQSQARFDDVIESIAESYYECDLEGVLTFVNTQFTQAMRTSAAEVTGLHFRRFTDREGTRTIYAAFNEVYKTGQPISRVSYRVRRRDGTSLDAELSVALRHDADGQPIGFRGLIRDVTEQRQAEEALRQSEEKYRTILENIEDGYYEIDLLGKMTYLTDVTARIAGMSRQAAMGRSFAEFTTPAHARTLFRIYNSVYRTGQAVRNLGYSIRTPDGEERFLEASASLIRDANGQPVGFRGIIRDMTERNRAEEELQHAKEAAEAANQAKSTFLTTVSHELRTPLTSVLGFAKLIKKRLNDVILPAVDIQDKRLARASQQVSANLDIIVTEGERLTALINNVLDLAKIEAGRIEWELRPVSMAEIVGRAVAATHSLAEQKQLPILTEIEPDLPTIIGDQDRLIQVVINLISNALKFTEQGAITCRAVLNGSDILVSVSDTGLGIDPADHERVFQEFVQVGNMLTDKPTGTGLGLPICRQIVEHHGGRIWVDSQLGSGSTFSFRLPVRSQAVGEADAPLPESVEMAAMIEHLKAEIDGAADSEPDHKSILIVDDDPHIRQLLRQALESDGYTVHEAADGRAALAQVRQVRPNLIILDVMMPELSGLDVAAVLRSDPDTRRIPIIIASILRDRERGYRIGIDRYFTKPLDTDLLLKEVGVLLRNGKSPKRVLVIEEDAAVVQTLTQVLEAQGYSVAAASGGQPGLQAALATPPDILIINSLLSEKQQLVQTLRFEKGLENVALLLFH